MLPALWTLDPQEQIDNTIRFIGVSDDFHAKGNGVRSTLIARNDLIAKHSKLHFHRLKVIPAHSTAHEKARHEGREIATKATAAGS